MTTLATLGYYPFVTPLPIRVGIVFTILLGRDT